MKVRIEFVPGVEGLVTATELECEQVNTNASGTVWQFTTSPHKPTKAFFARDIARVEVKL